ncbi:MAG TPA: patatin-like phospholipase family protein [Solirubrobacteraceae bacterium]|nr:patatin-like phospholipase family protein [Solirubrobacteraceae bacterium]
MAVHEADGVFQGGGVKGLALVGALLEFADQAAHPDSYVDRWMQVAGTSAGAIIAAYIACGHDAAQTQTLVQAAPYASFQDWGAGGEILGGGLNLLRVHGLAHGKVFHDWFRRAIDGQTFGDVKRAGRTLKMIATDITRREMLLLPDDLCSYRLAGSDQPIDPDAFEIADAVRMSMSIPYFFQPIELVHHETGKPSTIVDGGVLSNFPVWIFDVDDRDATRPTFGFRLVGGKSVGGGMQHLLHTLGWAAEMGSDIFHTANEAWDKRFASKSTRVRTCTVSAGTIGTTEFDLDDAGKRWLLDSGHDAAKAFLDSWTPEQYVNRNGQKLADAVLTG